MSVNTKSWILIFLSVGNKSLKQHNLVISKLCLWRALEYNHVYRYTTVNSICLIQNQNKMYKGKLGPIALQSFYRWLSIFSFRFEPAFENQDTTLNLLIMLWVTILKMSLIFRKLCKTEVWKTEVPVPGDYLRHLQREMLKQMSLRPCGTKSGTNDLARDKAS